MPKNSNAKKLIAIGEALIDFMPEESGCPIKDVCAFKPAVGGAPANVCGAFAKLGGESAMITKLGNDAFGDKIIEEFKRWNIGCENVLRTDAANTSLAFVALKEDGGREFNFYRNPGADMLLLEDEVSPEIFEDGYALHFCSVSLGDFPMKRAHKRAIEYAKSNGLIVSFDPNLRPALWTDEASMVKAVKEFLPLADIVKISDEELYTITGKNDIDEAMEVLFVGNVKLVIVTKGSEGASAFTCDRSVSVSGVRMKAVDTTGAGDGFIGAFLYCLYKDGVTAENIDGIGKEMLKRYLSFANAFCSISVQKKGAIASYPTVSEINI